jgi:hypothetical protein
LTESGAADSIQQVRKERPFWDNVAANAAWDAIKHGGWWLIGSIAVAVPAVFAWFRHVPLALWLAIASVLCASAAVFMRQRLPIRRPIVFSIAIGAAGVSLWVLWLAPRPEPDRRPMESRDQAVPMTPPPTASTYPDETGPYAHAISIPTKLAMLRVLEVPPPILRGCVVFTSSEGDRFAESLKVRLTRIFLEAKWMARNSTASFGDGYYQREGLVIVAKEEAGNPGIVRDALLLTGVPVSFLPPGGSGWCGLPQAPGDPCDVCVQVRHLPAY